MEPRPNMTSPRVREIAEAKVKEILERECGVEAVEINNEELSHVFHGWFIDHYKLAKSMEDHFGWDIEGSMLDGFEEIIGVIAKGYRQAEREWFARNRDGMKLPAVGSLVRFKHGKEETGTVTRIDDEGRAYIFSPALGHVETGPGIHAIIIPVERVTADPEAEK